MNALISRDKTSFLSLLPLLMVIFIDVAGVLLVLPVLTPLILDPVSSIVPQGTSVLMRDFLYGFSLALCPLFMFFSTPILGDLSDRYGRKKILLGCLIASALSYLVATFSVIYGSLSALLASRALIGLAAGTQPISTAAIIDVSTPKAKTKHLSWVVLATSIGVVFGPLIGGLSSEPIFSAGLGYAMPFILAALLSLVNAIFLNITFHDNPPKNSGNRIVLFKGFSLFAAAFREQKFRILSLLFCSYALAWSLYYQAITWLFMEGFHYSSAKLGAFIAYLGLINVLATMILPRIMQIFFSKEITAYLFFILVMGVGNIGAALASGEWGQWFWVILNAGGEVICFTVSLSVFSSLVAEDKQGWIMGVTGSLASITWTVGGLISGPLGYLDIRVPLWVSGGLCLLSFIFMMRYKRLV